MQHTAVIRGIKIRSGDGVMGKSSFINAYICRKYKNDIDADGR
jgi:hypothetical protein